MELLHFFSNEIIDHSSTEKRLDKTSIRKKVNNNKWPSEGRLSPPEGMKWNEYFNPISIED